MTEREPRERAPSLRTWWISALITTLGVVFAIVGVVLEVAWLVVAGAVVAVLAGLVMLVFGEKSASELSRGPKSR